MAFKQVKQGGKHGEHTPAALKNLSGQLERHCLLWRIRLLLHEVQRVELFTQVKQS